MNGLRPELDRAAPAALTAQIADYYAAAIEDGRLRVGDRLPPIRDLARRCEVTRATVQDAYRRLAERGLGVVIISHNLHDVFEVADRITVLRLGQRVAMLNRAETTQQEVVHAITAGTLDVVPGMDADEAAEA